MFCSISGTVPEKAVVSLKSGHLYEKTLVEKYVRETGKDPITGESLTLEDLLPLKVSKTVKPRTAPATSIPGLLGLFHDEWDAAMLEVHTMRHALHQTRQELSHALYTNDAASRVIVRLMRERDEAQAALENVRAQVAAELAAAPAPGAAGDAAAPAGPVAKAGIPDDVLAELAEVNTTLSKGRKKRPIPDSLASPEDLARLAVTASHPLHKTTAGGIVALDLNPELESVVATAGLDGTVQLLDFLQGRVLGALEGHSKRLTGVTYLGGQTLLTSSADKTCRVWRGSGGQYECASVLRDHTAEVVGVTAHPSRRYFVTGGADATWCFYDLDTLTCLKQVADPAVREAYTCVQFHPDGLILGTGTDKNVIRIWEVRQQKNVATFEGHSGAVRGLAFSENGYHLASAADDCVKLWDLRKLKNIKTIEPYADASPCNAVAFDHSGQYLAVGGADLRVYGQRQEWGEVRALGDLSKRLHCVRWGADARSLFVGGADHNLRVLGLGPSE